MTYILNNPNILKALFLTLIVEVAVLLIHKKTNIIFLVTIILMNIITNLTFNYYNRFLPSKYDFIGILILEVMIVFIESLVIWIFVKDYKKALYLSFVCNLASYVVGMVALEFIY